MKDNFEEKKTDLTIKTQGQSAQRDVLEKQLELISKVSEECANDVQVIKYLPDLTHAVVDLTLLLGQHD